jgi:hypothetical protein
MQEVLADEGLRLHTGCTGGAALPPDLARLVDVWPALPLPIRRAIMALVESTTEPGTLQVLPSDGTARPPREPLAGVDTLSFRPGGGQNPWGDGA